MSAVVVSKPPPMSRIIASWMSSSVAGVPQIEASIKACTSPGRWSRLISAMLSVMRTAEASAASTTRPISGESGGV